MKIGFVAACIAGVASGSACGGIFGFTGIYFQDFNGLAQSGSATIPGQGPHQLQGVLGNVGMEGWYGANFGGTSPNTEFRAQDGSLAGASGRGLISFGSTGSADRALGILPTSNQVPSFGLVLVNNTSDVFTALDISFIGEQWRAGGANIPNVLSFSYGFGTSLLDATTAFSSLDFATPFLGGGEMALNGNDPLFQSAIANVITGIRWAPGESLVLRWDMADLPGQDNGLAIDDLMIVGIIPAPGGFALLGLAGLAAARRRRR
ncbi:MAG TPA: hypothetical protein PKC43_13205 [Phycisphaerales bacterium]|nr:hypothetical protein [Phycisphaerales bacterium]HMP38390.1 hypothetical protein [Phycisphaerales bacterium]